MPVQESEIFYFLFIRVFLVDNQTQRREKKKIKQCYPKLVFIQLTLINPRNSNQIKPGVYVYVAQLTLVMHIYIGEMWDSCSSGIDASVIT